MTTMRLGISDPVEFERQFREEGGDGSRVILKKLSAAAGAEFPTPDREDYIPGQIGVPVDYEVEGYLLSDPKEEECLALMRTKRDGMPILGVMNTSLIQKITGQKPELTLRTINSVYVLTYLPDLAGEKEAE